MIPGFFQAEAVTPITPLTPTLPIIVPPVTTTTIYKPEVALKETLERVTKIRQKSIKKRIAEDDLKEGPPYAQEEPSFAKELAEQIATIDKFEGGPIPL